MRPRGASVDAVDMSRDRGAGGGPGIAGDRTRSVVVADDSAAVRRAMVDLIENDAAFAVVAQAVNATDAVDVTTSLQPDVAVLDVQMPGGGGAEAAARIREVAPATRIVAFSAFDDAFSRDAMERAGAIAYAVKGRDALLDVLRQVCSD
jgi:DNA-binding NarL/FixJ family response regulator